MKRALPPKLAAHGAKVAAAHAHLTATKPGFARLKPAQRFAQVQAHIRKGGG